MKELDDDKKLVSQIISWKENIYRHAYNKGLQDALECVEFSEKILGPDFPIITECLLCEGNCDCFDSGLNVALTQFKVAIEKKMEDK